MEAILSIFCAPKVLKGLVFAETDHKYREQTDGCQGGGGGDTGF